MGITIFEIFLRLKRHKPHLLFLLLNFTFYTQISFIRHPTSDIRHPTSDIRHLTSDIRHLTSDYISFSFTFSAQLNRSEGLNFHGEKLVSIFWNIAFHCAGVPDSSMAT